ncbi:MAG: disulfide oxidoreductase [Firmicutes bacterium HGW-Firmicutes-21]|nr:MAG: disulfide oxidoreductase [Firmicutes bacterium HGW-Firmicutes-21]
MEKITKDSLIGEVLEKDVDLAKYFFEIGMHCLGCPSARSETIEEACQVHGVDCNELLKKLNDAIKA